MESRRRENAPLVLSIMVEMTPQKIHSMKLRYYFAFAKFEKTLLIRADLMNVDVIEAGRVIRLYSGEIGLRIRTEHELLC
jgi:hypothetical protein